VGELRENIGDQERDSSIIF